MSVNRIPIVIDCDPGTDDAICIAAALLCDKNLDIRAITCVCGNVGVDRTSRNALDIVDLLGSDVPVSVGAHKPIRRELKMAISHGITGIGDVTLPRSTRNFHEKHAVDLLYDQVVKAEGALEILAIGPLTNLALAIGKYPDFPTMVKKITIMGGALIGGNMTMVSEFNIYNDPDAAKIVFDAGIPLVMVGLDVTLKPMLPDNILPQLAQVDTPHAKLVCRLLDFMVRRKEEIGGDNPNLHDVMALLAMVEPSLLTMQDYYMDVETEGRITRGMTVADFLNVEGKAPNVSAALDIDVAGFWDWFVTLFNR